MPLLGKTPWQVLRRIGFRRNQFGLMMRNKTGVDLAGEKVRVLQCAYEERIVGAQPGNLCLFQSMRQFRGCRFARSGQAAIRSYISRTLCRGH